MSFYGVLYIGVTNDVIKRVWEHKEKIVDGFTNTYNITKLVYFEEFSDIEEAIMREKRLKHWKREWKLDLIKKDNPKFIDLYTKLIS